MRGSWVVNRFGDMEDTGDSRNFRHLHSHSAIERDMLFPKDRVLIDLEYEPLFKGIRTERYEYKGMTYLRVPILPFVMRGGVFRNFRI